MITHLGVTSPKNPEEEVYLCNSAAFVNQDKLEYYWDKVNCKKCLKRRRKW